MPNDSGPSITDSTVKTGLNCVYRISNTHKNDGWRSESPFLGMIPRIIAVFTAELCKTGLSVTISGVFLYFLGMDGLGYFFHPK